MHSWYKDYDGLIKRVCSNYELALDKLVSEVKNKDVIELGCGTGNLTEKLIKNDNRVVAYDTDSFFLAAAKRKLSESKEVTFIHGDVLEAKFSAEKIVISSLMFHLLDKKKRFKIFKKIADAHSDLYIFDRIRGKTELEECQFKDSFKDYIKNLPNNIYSELVRENQSNSPDMLSDQREYFEGKGYKFKILFQKPLRGFVAYCFLKK